MGRTVTQWSLIWNSQSVLPLITNLGPEKKEGEKGEGGGGKTEELLAEVLMSQEYWKSGGGWR